MKDTWGGFTVRKCGWRRIHPGADGTGRGRSRSMWW